MNRPCVLVLGAQGWNITSSAHTFQRCPVTAVSTLIVVWARTDTLLGPGITNPAQ